MEFPASSPGPTGRKGARHCVAARRFGYLLVVVVNLVLLYLIHVQPGWQAAPFLTDAAAEVVGVLSLVIGAGIGLNLLYTVADLPWLRSLGDLTTAVIGVVVLSRLIDVFPFPLAAGSTGALVVRVLLIVALVGTAIGVLAHLVTLIRRLAGQEEPAS